MREPFYRRGAWWHQSADGTWLRWNKAADAWEEQSAPPPPPDDPPKPVATREVFSSPSTDSDPRLLTLLVSVVGGGLVFVGSFLPWARVWSTGGWSQSGFDIQRTGLAIEPWGYIVLAAGAIAALAALLQYSTMTSIRPETSAPYWDSLDSDARTFVQLLPLLAGLAAIVGIALGYRDARPGSVGNVTPIVGFWMVLLGALVSVGAGLVHQRRQT